MCVCVFGSQVNGNQNVIPSSLTMSALLIALSALTCRGHFRGNIFPLRCPAQRKQSTGRHNKLSVIRRQLEDAVFHAIVLSHHSTQVMMAFIGHTGGPRLP